MQSNLRVKLIEHTPNPERVIATAAKLCYANPDSIEDLMDRQTPESIEKFLNMLIGMGHYSPIEHVSFTFAVEGVSRSLTHQLVRHRLASYSQQSQRYVKLDQFEYIVPPAIEADSYLKKIYIQHMCASQNTYDSIVGKLKSIYILENNMSEKDATKKAIEDARYVFPNACETKIVFTMNARSLMNFLAHRCCDRSQWEIRALAWEMWKLVMQVAPNIFKHSGPGCAKGKCTEGSMSCGNKVAIKYNSSKVALDDKGMTISSTYSASQNGNVIVSGNNTISFK